MPANQITQRGGFDEVPYELQISTGIVYSHAGQSDRWADLCRRVIAAGGGPSYDHPRMSGYGVVFLGRGRRREGGLGGLLAAADATHNPMTACFALLAHGLAYQRRRSRGTTPYAKP